MTVFARAPAVAGHFYPAEPASLRRMVDRLLGAAPPSDEPLARAYVVPHAGYRYSGVTAAHVYAHLRQWASDIRRIILIGPSHFRPLLGCAVPAASCWDTPLGPIGIDSDGAAALVAAGLAVADDAFHAVEHSLEVQLPFLQRVLPELPRVLPIAVGGCAAPDVAAAISAAIAATAAAAVVLCSTDLSHYHDEQTARQRDAATIRSVLARDPDAIRPGDACGRYALRGLLAWASDLAPCLLDYRTSAQASGDSARVVGYAALALR